MKKLVLKTVAITLASIILAFAVAFGAACIFAPKFLAKCFDGVGAYSASVFFYEKQYKKSGVIEDLAILVDNIDAENDGARAEEYLNLLVSHEWFDSFCTLQDGGTSALISTKEYYSGQYAVTLVNNQKVEDAFSFCQSFTEKNDYGKNNPYRILESEFIKDKTFLAKLKEELLDCLQSVPLNNEGIELLVGDINELNLILR